MLLAEYVCFSSALVSFDPRQPNDPLDMKQEPLSPKGMQRKRISGLWLGAGSRGNEIHLSILSIFIKLSLNQIRDRDRTMKVLAYIFLDTEIMNILL